ncbi:diguanylate cyclase [Solidesulfovibrio fructosivorans JJ]]|uniref:diguanylate cyclase n=1 Tax=Solidesulfovibrio fructosivorans JJ] TaxID=596151 RepID=E1JZ20_SOLFR|nr:GGDEF domain-containing protein [Solidesulfovibrio fructosivorans]EFL50436.1 diguanylate cyclase [Solidesulfovibrio fructosivorans JJ]]
MNNPLADDDPTSGILELQRFLPEGKQEDLRCLVEALAAFRQDIEREKADLAAALDRSEQERDRLRERLRRMGAHLERLQDIFRVNDQAFATFRAALTLSRQLRRLADLPEVVAELGRIMGVRALSCLLVGEDFETFVPPGYPCPSRQALADALSCLPEASRGRRIHVGAVKDLVRPDFFFAPADLNACPELLAGSCFIAALGDKYHPGRVIGALSLADVDPDRYTPEKGTDFLEHFCEVLAGDLLHVKIHEELTRQRDNDELTGISNRASLRRNGPALLNLAERKRTPAALLFCDLDHFKAVNDLHGHETGDAVLRDVARGMAGRVRAYDLLARLGGDEFVVLMPDAGQQEAAVMAKRLRACVAQVARDRGLSGTPGLSVSIGVALFTPGQTIDDLVRRADAAMYADKRADAKTKPE